MWPAVNSLWYFLSTSLNYCKDQLLHPKKRLSSQGTSPINLWLTLVLRLQHETVSPGEPKWNLVQGLSVCVCLLNGYAIFWKVNNFYVMCVRPFRLGVQRELLWYTALQLKCVVSGYKGQPHLSPEVFTMGYGSFVLVLLLACSAPDLLEQARWGGLPPSHLLLNQPCEWMATPASVLIAGGAEPLDKTIHCVK